MTVVKTLYDIGDKPIARGTFLDEDGDTVASAPTAVTVMVLHPDGTTVDTYNSPDAAIVLGVVTKFTFPTPVDTAGKWTVRMKGTAGQVAAAEVEIVVRPSAFPSP
jgi:hypothetical protein